MAPDGQRSPIPATLSSPWRALLERVVLEYRRALADDLLAIACFGSVARGTPRPASDLDLYVVTRQRVSYLDPRLPIGPRVREMSEYRALREKGYDPDPAPVLHTVAELKRHPWILLDITHEGIIVYDPEGVLAGELDAVRRRLRELGSRRVEQPDGTWYWELKPDWRPGEVVDL